MGRARFATALAWVVGAAALAHAADPLVSGEVAARLPTSSGSRFEGCAPRVLAGRELCVCGHFEDPRAAAAALRLDGKPLEVVAAYSTSLQFRVPGGTAPGPHLLTEALGGREVCTTEVLRVRAELDRRRLRRGRATEMRLEVEGTEQPLSLQLTNRTPQVITLDGGDEQTAETSGSRPNAVTRTVRGRSPGDFDIRWELAGPVCPCLAEEGPVEIGTGGGERGGGAGAPVFTEQDCDRAIEPFLADPEEARERQEIRRRIQEREMVVDYWKRLCDRLGDDRELADRNRRRLQEGRRGLAELAREVGTELPTGCGDEGCCDGASCCAGLDPASEADQETLRRRLDCLIDRFRATNRWLQKAGSDFSWLLGRWREGADHRAMMGLIEEQLTTAGCEALGLSGSDCESVRSAIQGAHDAEEAVDLVQTLIRSGELPPSFVVKMVDAMAEAAGNAARVAVEGWERFRREMGATLAEEYRLLLCLQEINEALARLATECPRFCGQVVAAQQGKIRAERDRLNRLDQASRAAAADRLQGEEKKMIWPAFERALPAADRRWLDPCCGEGEGEVEIEVPGEDACARLVDRRLRTELGALYCFLYEIKITVECHPPPRSATVSYTYEIGADPKPGCCGTEHGRATAEGE
jgi:hypothetical protein